MGQKNITGEQDELNNIWLEYKKYGINVSERLKELALVDLNELSENPEVKDALSQAKMTKTLKKTETYYKNIIDPFGYTLSKLYRMNWDRSAVDTKYPLYVKIIEDIEKQLKENINDITKESIQSDIEEIKHLKPLLLNKDTSGVVNWFSLYKNSEIIYSYFKKYHSTSYMGISKIKDIVKKDKLAYIESKKVPHEKV